MKARQLRLIHFRSARQFELALDPKLNVFAGVNGAGKTTVLDALATMLSWAGARLRYATSKGRSIRDIDVHNEKDFALIELCCLTAAADQPEISWRLVHACKGRNPDADTKDPLNGLTSLTQLNHWAQEMRDQIGKTDEQCSIPLCVYYPVNRSVLTIPLRIREKHQFDLLEAYDSAFTSGADFKAFFEWFRNREDLENEGRADVEHFQPDRQLEAVRRSILAFLPDFTHISVKRNPLRMEVAKGLETLLVDQLSDGEKCLFAMIGDLGRRLAIANPTLSDPLKGEGIVLIDEVDLHLHPAWQRMVIPKLTQTFPNSQFVVSTHSPQVLGEVDARHIRILSVEPRQGLVCRTPDQARGLDSCGILEELMETSSRNEEVEEKLKTIFKLIDDDDLDAAKVRIARLRNEINGDIPELVRANSLITMMEADLVAEREDSPR